MQCNHHIVASQRFREGRQNNTNDSDQFIPTIIIIEPSNCLENFKC